MRPYSAKSGPILRHGAFQWLPQDAEVFSRIRQVYQKLPASVFLRAADAIHLAAAAESGFLIVYSNDALLLAAAQHFGIQGKNIIGKPINGTLAIGSRNGSWKRPKRLLCPFRDIGNSSAPLLRSTASTLRASNTYLGAQFRRLRTKLGLPVAIKAMAAKLARLVYRMLRFGMNFEDQGAEVYEAQIHQRQVRHLEWKAVKLGFRISEIAAS